jgi:hypothetical protein
MEEAVGCACQINIQQQYQQCTSHFERVSLLRDQAAAGNMAACAVLRAAGCPWDENVAAAAAGAGQLRTLQWYAKLFGVTVTQLCYVCLFSFAGHAWHDCSISCCLLLLQASDPTATLPNQ